MSVSGPWGELSCDRRTLPARAGRLLQNLLICALTLILLAIVLVVVPGLMPPGLRDALGLGPRHQLLAAGPGSYAFEHIQPGTADMPVTYSSCAPLHYVVNLDGAPSNDPKASFVFSAVKRASAASGLKFVYDGPTTEAASAWNTRGGPDPDHVRPRGRLPRPGRWCRRLRWQLDAPSRDIRCAT